MTSVSLDDIYVTEPADTPRCVWVEDDDPVDWMALMAARAPRSGVRRIGEMDLEEW